MHQHLWEQLAFWNMLNHFLALMMKLKLLCRFVQAAGLPRKTGLV